MTPDFRYRTLYFICGSRINRNHGNSSNLALYQGVCDRFLSSSDIEVTAFVQLRAQGNFFPARGL
uniref:Uncharacterized protein n=1 Tax=Rhizophagus irregularis (strain DAOM 181602 / DAOM 197198 / MUCL 43194) TaxID=747089 RepID=U9U747_RHIID